MTARSLEVLIKITEKDTTDTGKRYIYGKIEEEETDIEEEETDLFAYERAWGYSRGGLVGTKCVEHGWDGSLILRGDY